MTGVGCQSIVKDIGERSAHAIRALLRALLRECTYLPDPAARVYFRNHIVNRFKAYHPGPISGPPEVAQHKLPIIEERAPKLLKDARDGLRKLRRANQGEITPLENVLYATWGRTGRRRHDLLDVILVPDTPTEYTPLLKYLKKPQTKEDEIRLTLTNPPRWLDVYDSGDHTPASLLAGKISSRYSRLKAVVESQRKERPPDYTRALLRQGKPNAPARNIWNRPLPIKRLMNAVKNFHATVLEKILPPLPEKEFELLGDLAHGRITVDIHRPRRKGRERQLEELAPLELQPLLDQQPNSNIRQRLLEHDLLARNLPNVNGHMGKDRGHVITRRLMRRLWMKVYLQSCVLRWNEQQGAWSVEWGRGKVWGATQNPGQESCQRPVVDASPLFDGVDKRGKKVESGLEALGASLRGKPGKRKPDAKAFSKEQLKNL